MKRDKTIIDMDYASLYPSPIILYDYHETLKEILEERRRVKLLEQRRLKLNKILNNEN